MRLQNLTLSAKKRTNLVVKWAAPEHDGGSKVTEYTLRWDGGNRVWSPEDFGVVYVYALCTVAW